MKKQQHTFHFASQLCVTALPFRANRLTPVYLANPFYFWGVTCSSIQQIEYLESFVLDAIKDTRTNKMKFLLVTWLGWWKESDT